MKTLRLAFCFLTLGWCFGMFAFGAGMLCASAAYLFNLGWRLLPKLMP